MPDKSWDTYGHAFDLIKRLRSSCTSISTDRLYSPTSSSASSKPLNCVSPPQLPKGAILIFASASFESCRAYIGLQQAYQDDLNFKRFLNSSTSIHAFAVWVASMTGHQDCSTIFSQSGWDHPLFWVNVAGGKLHSNTLKYPWCRDAGQQPHRGIAQQAQEGTSQGPHERIRAGGSVPERAESYGSDY